ncbi:hypothetical protein PVAND_003321 [Polypedilum vanderplanki]|uniref:C2H2-type domain-containing protein n=1 Tax=Polypedilum vanderplanki TaxID=319348 RepID=A0A9J6BU54_POLVA|nr:hypothetical protein PVAND_003321 [Polypedilum vanderplanki]
MDPVVQAIINNINGQIPVSVTKEVLCEICNISVSSYVVLRDHIAGKKHKKQFKFLCRKKNAIDLNCTICNYICKDNNDYEQHVTSESHVERAKRITPAQSVEIPPPPQPIHTHYLQPVPPQPELLKQDPPKQQQLSGPSNETISQNNIPQSLIPNDEMQMLQKQMQDKLNEKALRQILAKDRKEWNCVNCNVTCQSIQSWEAHLASKKHRKNRHKFHTYPGISKEFVRKKYQSSFVRAFETVGNEFIEDGMVFYCKRCDVRMETKLQLEIHMTSNQHKMNHPIEPVRTMPSVPGQDYGPVQNNPQLFNFENSSYGYGFRNWSAEQFVFNTNFRPPPTQTQAEYERYQEMERQRLLVEEAKNKLLARFPFYAINLQQNAVVEDPSSVPLPVPPPPPPAEPEQ